MGYAWMFVCGFVFGWFFARAWVDFRQAPRALRRDKTPIPPQRPDGPPERSVFPFPEPGPDLLKGFVRVLAAPPPAGRDLPRINPPIGPLAPSPRVWRPWAVPLRRTDATCYFRCVHCSGVNEWPVVALVVAPREPIALCVKYADRPIEAGDALTRGAGFRCQHCGADGWRLREVAP